MCGPALRHEEKKYKQPKKGQDAKSADQQIVNYVLQSMAKMWIRLSGY